MNSIYKEILKGLFISVIYLGITKVNDTNIQNISLFALFYVILSYSARILDVDNSIILNAFVTKTVFTLIEQRINKKKDDV